MSLSSKIAMKKFSKEVFPQFEKRIINILGYNVQFVVDWDSFNKEVGSAHFFEFDWAQPNFEKYCFGPLEEALKTMCEEEEFKSFLIENLKTIDLSATKGPDVQYGVATFSGNTLYFRSHVTADYGPMGPTIVNMIFDAINKAG